MPLTLSGSGGITYPDGSVNTTRSASVAGDTFTGRINIERNVSDNNPALRIYAPSAGAETFPHATHELAASLTANQSLLHVIGKQNTTSQSAWIGYQHTADGSALNRGSLGMWGKDYIVNWNCNGHVTMPYQPGFSVSYSGGVIADNTVIVWNITSDAGRFNQGSHYNSSNGRFTAPIAGRYLFGTQVHHHSGFGTPGGHHYFDFRINGTVAARFIGYWTVDNWYDMNHQVIFNLAAGDYVDVLVFYAQSQWMGGNRADHNRFFGYLVG